MRPIGYCRFCNNSRMVEDVPSNLDELGDDVAQEILNEHASRECDCEGACANRKREADRETASAYIDDVVEKAEVAEALKAFIEVLQARKATSVSVKIDDKTKITLDINQDGALGVKRVDTLKTQYGTD